MLFFCDSILYYMYFIEAYMNFSAAILKSLFFCIFLAPNTAFKLQIEVACSLNIYQMDKCIK